MLTKTGNWNSRWGNPDPLPPIIHPSSSYLCCADEDQKKKQAQFKNRLVHNKQSQHIAHNNAQWEDQQLLKSGAARVTTEFDDDDDDDENEHSRVILHFHDTKPPFLDGRIVYTKQAEPILPLKDPTSNMAIISRKGSNLVRQVHQKTGYE